MVSKNDRYPKPSSGTTTKGSTKSIVRHMKNEQRKKKNK